MSSSRYDEFKQLFTDHDIILSDDDIEIYANAFDIISTLISDKLTTIDLFEAFDFLSDLILDKKPKYAALVLKKDRVRVQLRVMEEIPQTAGKLTAEEKEILAFCVYHINCVSFFDEKTDSIVSGLADFTSADHIKKMFLFEKEQRPDFFKTKEETKFVPYDKYGFTIEYPIMLSSIPMSYKYLNLLRYKNNAITFERIGSAFDPSNEIVDMYRISYIEKKLFHKEEKTWTLYINPNADKPFIKAPIGFTLVKD